MQLLNELFREKAYFNGIKFIDTWNGFTDQFGRYSAFGPDVSGRVRRLRKSDGIHFTEAGYIKLAHYVEREIKRDLAAAKEERNIPLAGDTPEQTRILRRARSLAVRGGQDLAPSALTGQATQTPNVVVSKAGKTQSSRSASETAKGVKSDKSKNQKASNKQSGKTRGQSKSSEAIPAARFVWRSYSV